MSSFSTLRAGVVERYRRLATLWAVVPALVVMAVFLVLFEVTGRMAGAGGSAVLELQKAFTPDRFGAVVAAWGDGVAAFKWSLIVLDFAFPLVYAAGLAGLVALAAGPEPRRGALWLFALPWAAAGLDWTENLLHLWLLREVHTATAAAAAVYPGPTVMAASVAAMLKFALLLAASGGAAVLAMRRRRWWIAATTTILFASFTPVLWI